MAPSPELWRVFPWDAAAPQGEPFSASYVPRSQGSGRFDLVGIGVLYLAEDAVHAVAERIARFRGTDLGERHLREWGRPLALTRAQVPESVLVGVLDLCDPQVLATHGIRPDQAAAGDSATSQSVSTRIHDAGFTGFRWWSSFMGEWHGVVLFMDRVRIPRSAWSDPERLRLDQLHVRSAAAALGMRIGP